jgi:hypothetical protein
VVINESGSSEKRKEAKRKKKMNEIRSDKLDKGARIESHGKQGKNKRKIG